MVDATLRPNGLLGGSALDKTREPLTYGGLLGAPSLLVPKSSGLALSGVLLTSGSSLFLLERVLRLLQRYKAYYSLDTHRWHHRD